MLIAFFLTIVSVLGHRGVQLKTGRVVQWEDGPADPSAIERLRLSVSKVQADGAKNTLTVHILRLKWTAPHSWNDAGVEAGRSFSIICEAEDAKTNESLSLLDMSISSDITAVHERFVLPEGTLSIICAVRAVNSDDRKSVWKYSKLILIGADLRMQDKEHREDLLTGETHDSPVRTESLELLSLLSLSKKEEVPFPEWKKRPALTVDGREILGTWTEEMVTTGSSPEPTTERVTAEPMGTSSEPTDQRVTPGPTTVTLEPVAEGTTEESTTTEMSRQEIMKMLKESELTPIDPPFQEALSKADQIIHEPDLFLRGLQLRPLPIDSKEHEQDLPFHTGIFDSQDILRLSPGGLTSVEKEDYDILEQRLREAIGSQRVL